MHKAFAAFGLFVATGLSNTALAGPADRCHFHGSKPATEATVVKCADQRKDTLVKSGKLEGSWASVSIDSISMIDGKKGKEWRVVYANTAAADKAKTTLFMFFTPVGNFIAANHTGQ